MWNFPTILNTEHRPQLKVRGLGSSWNLKSNYAGWGKGGGGVRGIFVIIFTWTMKYEIRVFLGEVVRPPPFPTPPRSVHIHVINFKKFKTSVSKKKKCTWSPLLLRVYYRDVRCTLQLWASIQQVHLYTRQARILIDVLKRCVSTGSSIAEEIGFL